MIAVPAAKRRLGETGTLGLIMRQVREGTEVLRVAEGSAGARAGLRSRDVITRINEEPEPSPSQIARAFAQLRPERPLLAAVTRGDSHYILAIER